MSARIAPTSLPPALSYEEGSRRVHVADRASVDPWWDEECRERRGDIAMAPVRAISASKSRDRSPFIQLSSNRHLRWRSARAPLRCRPYVCRFPWCRRTRRPYRRYVLFASPMRRLTSPSPGRSCQRRSMVGRGSRERRGDIAMAPARGHHRHRVARPLIPSSNSRRTVISVGGALWRHCGVAPTCVASWCRRTCRPSAPALSSTRP